MMKIRRTIVACEFCGKSTQTGFNRPKSLHKTKRLIQPNLQKWNGFMICNRCRRTIAKLSPEQAKQLSN